MSLLLDFASNFFLNLQEPHHEFTVIHSHQSSRHGCGHHGRSWWLRHDVRRLQKRQVRCQEQHAEMWCLQSQMRRLRCQMIVYRHGLIR